MTLDKMVQIIINLSIVFNELFQIRYNSLIGYVVVLINKNFEIPSTTEIERLLFKNNN